MLDQFINLMLVICHGNRPSTARLVNNIGTTWFTFTKFNGPTIYCRVSSPYTACKRRWFQLALRFQHLKIQSPHVVQYRWHTTITWLHVNTHCFRTGVEKGMKLSTAVQEGCGYKDTLRAHRNFAPSAKYFHCVHYLSAAPRNSSLSSINTYSRLKL